jgi:hypothetical protein
MNRLTRFATFAALTVAANAFAEESASHDARRMLARAELSNAQAAAASIALDEYVGRYVTSDGVEFVVVIENNALVIDLPADWGATESRLRAEGTGDFFVADVSVLVSFRTVDGRVTGLVAYPARSEAPVMAVRVPLSRGIVTIEDVYKSPGVLATAPIRRGIVTIHDVYEDVPTRLAAATE